MTNNFFIRKRRKVVNGIQLTLMEKVSLGARTPISHASLAGLGQNDHPQYTLTAETAQIVAEFATQNEIIVEEIQQKLTRGEIEIPSIREEAQRIVAEQAAATAGNSTSLRGIEISDLQPTPDSILAYEPFSNTLVWRNPADLFTSSAGSSTSTTITTTGVDPNDFAVLESRVDNIEQNYAEQSNPAVFTSLSADTIYSGGVDLATLIGGGPGVTDHGALTGLLDNDHPQYALSANLETVSASLETHTADTSIHFTEASIDHGSISGLLDNDHPQYALTATNVEFQAITATSDIYLTNTSTSVIFPTGLFPPTYALLKFDSDITEPVAVPPADNLQGRPLSFDYASDGFVIQDNIAAVDVSGVTFYSGGVDLATLIAGAGVTDHGALTGLLDDDHPQYALSANLETVSASLETHTADTSIHFTEASIDHGSIAGLTDNDHPQYALSANLETVSASLETHTADTSIHFTVSSLNLDQYTTDTEFDAHTADTSIHFTEASIDHGSISGLLDNDHPQYALTGVSNEFGDLTASTLYSNGDIYANYDGPDGDSFLYFYEGGSATGRHLKWDNTDVRFEFNDELYVIGGIETDTTVTAPTIDTTTVNASRIVVDENSTSGWMVIDPNSSNGLGVSIRHETTTGAWARGYNFSTGGSLSDITGGFGARGTASGIDYLHIGRQYNDTTIRIDPDTYQVGIGANQGVVAGYDLAVDGDALFGDDIHLGNTEGDSYIYFYEGGSNTGRHLKWDDGDNRFEFNDTLYLAAGTLDRPLYLASTSRRAGITFEDDTASTQLDWDGTLNTFDIYGDIHVGRTATDASVKFASGGGRLTWDDSDSRFEFNDDVLTKSLLSEGSLYVNFGGANTDGNIYFDTGSNPFGAYLRYETDNNRFVLNDSLRVTDLVDTAASYFIDGVRVLDYASSTVAVGRDQAAGGSNNVFIGTNALDSNTNDEQVAVGVFAGDGTNATSFVRATLMGYAAANGATGTLSDMTAIGWRAARESIDADGGTYVGSYAGYFQTGDSVVSVGYLASYQAANENSTSVGMEASRGSSSRFTVDVGWRAGRNGDSDNNVNIGYLAATDSPGGDNVAIGQYAHGDSSTSNSESVYVGKFAGYQSVNTDDVVVVGNRAGYQSTGSSNVYIGRGAGTESDMVRSVAIGQTAGKSAVGTDNIHIGYNVGNGSTNSNELLIGNTVSNATPIISGDLSTNELWLDGDVTIGGTLTVDGDDVAKSVDVQVFNSDGTWNKPTGAKWVEVMMWGGGGGGGGGARYQGAGTSRGGGAGGSGGVFMRLQYNASDLGSSEAVTVGSGGTGGAAQVGNGVGSPGTDGGSSSFNGRTALGGKGGSRGGSSSAAGGASAIALSPIHGSEISPPGPGGIGGFDAAGGDGYRHFAQGGSGGGGGSGNVGGAGYSGGEGGDKSTAGTDLTGGNPGAGTNGLSQNMGGDGGGGGTGGGESAGSATNGFAGGIPGGAGGGGGGYQSITQTGTAGSGGNGARGQVIIVTHF